MLANMVLSRKDGARSADFLYKGSFQGFVYSYKAADNKFRVCYKDRSGMKAVVVHGLDTPGNDVLDSFATKAVESLVHDDDQD